MLLLENLKKIDDLIMADFYFPGSEARGSITFDVQKRDIVEANCGNRDPNSIYGFMHLVDVLKMMIKHNKYPEKYEYFWY